jgi:ATP-binding cassette, subfamily F, member 3
VGPNGSGKSTMMKMLAGVEPMSGGERIVGPSVQAGYFAQNLAESLNYEKTVLDELGDSAEGRSTGEIRSILGAMLFSGDDVYKKVSVLSGGERARLALAKVLARPSNCLLLDEPTNNLDIVAKDTLLEALRRFPGTVIIVSHDRFILNELVNEVLEVGQGHAIRYLGNYDDYLAKKAAMEAAIAPASKQDHSVMASSHAQQLRGTNGQVAHPKNAERAKSGKSRDVEASNDDRDAMRQRERVARQRSQIEKQIEQKETERAALSAEMNDPNFYLARKDADDLIARYERLGREIETLYTDLVKFEAPAAASDN